MKKKKKNDERETKKIQRKERKGLSFFEYQEGNKS